LLETLKRNDEDWRSFVDFNFLGSLDVGLALVAVPLVVLVQDLWLFELIEAVIDAHIFFLVLLVLVISINNWGFSLNT
jgi:hypothetical protein